MPSVHNLCIVNIEVRISVFVVCSFYTWIMKLLNMILYFKGKCSNYSDGMDNLETDENILDDLSKPSLGHSVSDMLVY